MSEHTQDPTSSPDPDAEAGAASASSSLFDIRIVIGGLFVFYGIVVTIMGIVESEEAEAQANGIDINLWSGLAMLAFGIGMLGWLRASRRG